MASIVTVVDDLDGSQDSTTQTRTFEFGGSQYEIDLSDVNAKALADAQSAFAEAVKGLRVFLNAGRLVSRRKASSASVPARSKEENDAIRNWANSNGFSVSDKGRIPEDAVAAFDAAHAPKDKSKS